MSYKDTTYIKDYQTVRELIAKLDGEEAAQAFADNTNLEDVLLDTVSVLLSGKENGADNEVQPALGKLLCYGLRHGTTGNINGMSSQVLAGTYLKTLNMSAPQRTAGGRGSSPYVTVNSTASVTTEYEGTWVLVYLYSGADNICVSPDIADFIANGDTLNVNWTVSIGGGYALTQRAQMAKALSPESGYGTTMYAIGKCKVKVASGDVQISPYAVYGGSGNDSQLLVEYRYVHSGASSTISSFEILNTNGDLIHLKGNVSKTVSNGKVIKIYHAVDFSRVGG